jgi:hypothetical protein
MRLRLAHQPPRTKVPNALNPLPLQVTAMRVQGPNLDQICRVHRLLLVDRNCSLSQVDEGMQVVEGHFFGKVKKFFLMQGMWVGVKYRSSRPPPRRPRGARPGWLAATCICPQGFIHSYPQILVDNL